MSFAPYDRRFASTADLQSLVRKYMSMLGLNVAPAVKTTNSLGARNLGACKWKPGQPTTTVVIHKSVLGDPITLERIVAHEMAHHAAFLDAIKEMQGIEQEKGTQAAPYIQGYVRKLRREDEHGEGWLRYVKIINAQMGNDFVTKTGDQSYVQDATTKPYYVMIAMLPNNKYGFQIGVNLSQKMKQTIAVAGQQYGAKVFKTTDPRWQHGPRIGSLNWATSTDKQDEMQRLHSSNTTAERVARRFAMEHATPEAKKQYLQDHPKADPNKHTVKSDKTEDGSPKIKDNPHSFRDKADDHAKAGRHDKAFEQFSVAAEAFKQKGDHAAAKSMTEAARQQAKLHAKAQKKR